MCVRAPFYPPNSRLFPLKLLHNIAIKSRARQEFWFRNRERERGHFFLMSFSVPGGTKEGRDVPSLHGEKKEHCVSFYHLRPKHKLGPPRYDKKKRDRAEIIPELYIHKINVKSSDFWYDFCSRRLWPFLQLWNKYENML